MRVALAGLQGLVYITSKDQIKRVRVRVGAALPTRITRLTAHTRGSALANSCLGLSGTSSLPI